MSAGLHHAPKVDEVDLDVDHDYAPLQFRRIDDVLNPSMPPGLAQQEMTSQLLMANGVEPSTFVEAQQHECWHHAMLDKMTALEANAAWELIDPPPRTRAIGLKWVFNMKKDAVGFIVKHKARLVTKGYVQQQGIDFDEVFAMAACLESVWLLLAYVANEGWFVHHMDVKLAFLNDKLQEQVFVK